MMIHNPWTSSVGDADQLRKDADFLDQCKKVIMSFYRGKFACDEEKLAELMSEETWYTGAECAENGLACTVVKSDVKAAAKVGQRQFASMPDAVKALYAFREMDAETRAKIESSVKAEEGEGAEPTDTPDAEPSAEPVAEPSAEPVVQDQWEARFKGASRKINELQASITAKDVEIAEFKNQVEALQKDLADATAKVSAFSGKLEEGAKALEVVKHELAESRDSHAKALEQVKHLKETRSLLTGGVLTLPADEVCVASGKTPEAREALRKQKAGRKSK
jgi:small-conductance mechanosensitive channel